MSAVLLDSTVIIDYLRGQREVVAKLDALLDDGERFGACALNVAEVFAGMREGEREVTERWLSSLDWYDISYSIAQMAGELRSSLRRSGRTVHLTDLLIGCTARAHDATLVTANVKDFPVPGLQLERVPSGRR